MGISRDYMIDVLKRRGWTSLRVKQFITKIENGRKVQILSPLWVKYGGVAPIEECPEYQIRAIYLKGDHYKTPKKAQSARKQKDKQLTFEF